MFFWFKRKKILVDCFTDEPGAYEFHPIKKATLAYPMWWKNLNNQTVEQSVVGNINRSTIKGCDGIITLFKNSHVITAWTDIRLKTNSENYFYYFGKKPLNDFHNSIASHNKLQFGPAFDNKIHLKLMSPWYLKQNRFCEFIMMPAIWNDIPNWNKFTIMPGMSNFLYQHSTNINMFVEKNQDHILIEAGTPFYHIIPQTESDVEFKCHLVTSQELNKLIHVRYGKFANNYKFTRRLVERIHKCPLGFTKD